LLNLSHQIFLALELILVKNREQSFGWRRDVGTSHAVSYLLFTAKATPTDLDTLPIPLPQQPRHESKTPNSGQSFLGSAFSRQRTGKIKLNKTILVNQQA